MMNINKKKLYHYDFQGKLRHKHKTLEEILASGLERIQVKEI